MDLPDSTTERLRTAYEEKAQTEQRWQDLVATACEIAGVDPETARIDLQAGVIQEPDPQTDGDTSES
jgi:hypothetical protein